MSFTRIPIVVFRDHLLPCLTIKELLTYSQVCHGWREEVLAYSRASVRQLTLIIGHEARLAPVVLSSFDLDHSHLLINNGGNWPKPDSRRKLVVAHPRLAAHGPVWLNKIARERASASIVRSFASLVPHLVAFFPLVHTLALHIMLLHQCDYEPIHELLTSCWRHQLRSFSIITFPEQGPSEALVFHPSHSYALLAADLYWLRELRILRLDFNGNLGMPMDFDLHVLDRLEQFCFFSRDIGDRLARSLCKHVPTNSKLRLLNYYSSALTDHYLRYLDTGSGRATARRFTQFIPTQRVNSWELLTQVVTHFCSITGLYLGPALIKSSATAHQLVRQLAPLEQLIHLDLYIEIGSCIETSPIVLQPGSAQPAVSLVSVQVLDLSIFMESPTHKDLRLLSLNSLFPAVRVFNLSIIGHILPNQSPKVCVNESSNDQSVVNCATLLLRQFANTEWATSLQCVTVKKGNNEPQYFRQYLNLDSIFPN